jgi:hypothetical protein
VEEYEAAGGDGYNDPFETEGPLDSSEDENDEYREESDLSIEYDPNEEDSEARWEKIERDREKARDRVE